MPYNLRKMEFVGGKNGPIATVSVVIEKPDGSEVSDTATSEIGVVDAAAKAIQRALGITMDLEAFGISAIGPGSNADGKASVRLRYESVAHEGVGVGRDIVVASAEAFIDALNNPIPSEPSITAYEFVT